MIVIEQFDNTEVSNVKVKLFHIDLHFGVVFNCHAI